MAPCAVESPMKRSTESVDLMGCLFVFALDVRCFITYRTAACFKKGYATCDPIPNEKPNTAVIMMAIAIAPVLDLCCAISCPPYRGMSITQLPADEIRV